MNAFTLPEPMAAYFAAEHNAEALAHCFTAQAVMKDDGHIYTGVNAIQAFMAAASAKYRATSVPFALDREDGVQVVRAKVTGNFPGSPIDLSYRFRLERGLIASLEITA
ncbi:nuclear transport factor 2 family protein [Variovorax sp. OV329]|uniref:nuclear transport factor 2 family protein n=1 Tax=Variovorax sp. OV329 TaxID=1882825 RepID=UPI0008ECEC36|nr:nuclear transport factor 2 family protein [Variovorax sp. OV329]SFN53663.1 SnoaL-like domain-containing protein [Variovorax sp. OV329]